MLRLDNLLGEDQEYVLNNIESLCLNHPSYNMRKLPEMVSQIISYGNSKFRINRMKSCLHRISSLDLNHKEFDSKKDEMKKVLRLMGKYDHLFRIQNEIK